jgi:2-keto-4-pentenoate hydratase/2-oxohepta-3-ene-1,7-dioic acid hydratase in catechol pathway
VGHGREPPVYLEPGDQIRIEISGLGVLESPVVAAE